MLWLIVLILVILAIAGGLALSKFIFLLLHRGDRRRSPRTPGLAAMGTPDTPIPASGGRNVLVVSTVEEIGSALNAQLHEDDVVKVVVPVVGQGVLDWLANDEKAFSHSVKVADRLADELPGETVDAGAGKQTSPWPSAMRSRRSPRT